MLSFLSTFFTFSVIFSARIPCEDNDDFDYDAVYELTSSCRASPTQSFCNQPANLANDRWVSSNFQISGYLYINEVEDTARVQIYGEGFPDVGFAGGFFLTQNGGIRDPATTHPIYFDIAASAAPIAPITASFNGGLDPNNEPNVFRKDGNNGYLDVIVDYNPLKAFQTPVTNRPNFITQEGISCTSGDGVNFPIVDDLCQNEYKDRAGRFAPIARSYLREFNADGSVKVDSNGRQVVVRGPQPADWITILGNADGTTFGYAPSLPSSSDSNRGNSFEIAVFSLNPVDLVETDEDDIDEDFEDYFDDFCDDDDD